MGGAGAIAHGDGGDWALIVWGVACSSSRDGMIVEGEWVWGQVQGYLPRFSKIWRRRNELAAAQPPLLPP
jgi:hypothetical protein